MIESHVNNTNICGTSLSNVGNVRKIDNGEATITELIVDLKTCFHEAEGRFFLECWCTHCLNEGWIPEELDHLSLEGRLSGLYQQNSPSLRKHILTLKTLRGHRIHIYYFYHIYDIFYGFPAMHKCQMYKYIIS
jgi:hypothetical protein